MVELAHGYRVEVVTDFERFLSLEKEWNALLSDTEQDIPPMRHEWFRVWWKSLVSDQVSAHICIASKGSDLCAIAPLVKLQRRKGGEARLRSMTLESFRYGFISRMGDREAVRAILCRCLEETGGTSPVLELGALPATSQTLQFVEELARPCGYYIYHYRTFESPYVRIDGDWSGYQTGLDSRFKRNLRNREKRLRNLGALSYEVVASAAELPKALDDCFRIEASGWKGKQGTAIACDRRIADAYAELTHTVWLNGWLDLCFLKVGDRRIAFGYHLKYGGKYYLLKTGYDPEYAPYSPGQQMIQESLRLAFMHGIEEYDFLGDTMIWKRDWTPLSRPHVSAVLYSRDCRGAVSFFGRFGWKKGSKRLLRRLLPSLAKRLFDG